MNNSYPLDLVLPYVKHGRVDLEGDSVRVGRFLVFAVKGTKCVDCGLKAEFFKKETSNGTVIVNLYGIGSNNRHVLFTRDHIIPASRGGTKLLKNIQPMCVDCNNKKGDFISVHDKIEQSLHVIKGYFHGLHVRTKTSYRLIRAIWRRNYSTNNMWKLQ